MLCASCDRIVERMTINTVRYCPSVFDAGLPVFHYDHLSDPDEALRVIADTRRLTPIAIGPYGN
jgi:hypothetical protein